MKSKHFYFHNPKGETQYDQTVTNAAQLAYNWLTGFYEDHDPVASAHPGAMLARIAEDYRKAIADAGKEAGVEMYIPDDGTEDNSYSCWIEMGKNLYFDALVGNYDSGYDVDPKNVAKAFVKAIRDELPQVRNHFDVWRATQDKNKATSGDV